MLYDDTATRRALCARLQENLAISVQQPVRSAVQI